MADTGRSRVRTVEQIMSHPVITATSSETVAEAAARMSRQGVGSTVVVDDGRPTGILTERDLVGLAASGADPTSSKVSEWMTETPDTIDPREDVTEAFRTLSERGYRHLPVVIDGRLTGIVSIRDLMKIAQIQAVETFAAEVPKGLEGV